jgi:hypothetical protein
MIGKQGYAIGKHSGQWKMLLIILTSGIGLMTTIVSVAYYGQQESIMLISQSVHSIDKTMTAYVASHTAQSTDGFRRITRLEESMIGMERRMDKLEQN